jgi:hypothetical protein
MTKKRRILPLIEGIKAPFFFHKDPKKAMLALLASFITESRRQNLKRSPTFYEVAERRGELGTLQKFLGADDCETITDGKLFNAYKLALAESDDFFGSLTDAVDWDRPSRSWHWHPQNRQTDDRGRTESNALDVRGCL